jgi:uncharacterized repeat protein (TIGR03803 family)
MASHGQSVLTSLLYFGSTNGAGPYGGLVAAPDHNLYGVTQSGGAYGTGAFFRMTTNGALTLLFSFSGTNGTSPETSLTLGPDGYLYGTASGGLYGDGLLFKASTTGAVTPVVVFNSTNGANPQDALAVGNDSALYGLTTSGSTNGYGSIYRLTTNGLFTTLTAFASDCFSSAPCAALTLAGDGKFYGATYDGGTNELGSIFCVTTNGALTTLVSFNTANGAYPKGDMVLARDGNLYGTTFYGGTNGGYGTLFRITTNGVFTNLVHLANTNGAYPEGGLVLGQDGNIYGTTTLGGITSLNYGLGCGSLFKITTNGMFTTMACFNNTNGANPRARLAQASDGYFYGTTLSGTNDYGTVFRFAPAFYRPPLNYSVPGRKMVVTWDSSAYYLQTSSTPHGIFVSINGAVSPYTNSPTLPQLYFRLLSH